MGQGAVVEVVLALRRLVVKIEGLIDGSFAEDTREHGSLPECTGDSDRKGSSTASPGDGSKGVATLFGDVLDASESFAILPAVQLT